jgi:D-tyrosyl-tRNA(Tyr) deacylase
MKVVLQKVKYAKCTVNNENVGSIGNGYLLLVGICDTDNQSIINKIAKKIVDLRIYEDKDGKMNLGIKEVGGDLLSISQFTLYANCKKGRRPSFVKASKPSISEPLYSLFNQALIDLEMKVETGIFGADMQIELLNDGPCTIVLDSDEIC